MHDFGVTATRVVVFDLPAVFDLEALIGGGTGIRWDPDHGARIGVLERGAPGDAIRWIEVEPFWVFHFLNAHDDGDALVVLGCRADRLNTSFGDEAGDGRADPLLHRWRIDPVAGTVTDDALDDRPADFPRVADAVVGLDARHGYVGRLAPTGDGDDLAVFDGVVKHDLRTGTSTSVGYGPHCVSGEPVFAADPARSSDEDGGWLLNWVHDLDADESAAVVLDAATLEEVARVHAPRRIPFGFHGIFRAGS
jgi:carotenoid cleavage dioxygenase